MAKSTLLSGVLQVLLCSAALLWLLWCFVPFAAWIGVFASLAIVLVAGQILWRRYRQSVAAGENVPVIELPPPDLQGPIVLVCGEGLASLFPDRPLRTTAQGCWLKVNEVSALADVLRAFQALRPQQVGQLCVMFTCLPDAHQDQGVLRAGVNALRQQINRLQRLTGCDLPLVVSAQFSGPDTPWAIVRGRQASVCQAEALPLDMATWQQAADNMTRLPVLKQAFGFLRETIVDELTREDRLCPPLYPVAVTLRSGAAGGEADSLWSRHLFARTQLRYHPAMAGSEHGERFADALLPMLSPFTLPPQGGQGAQRTSGILLFCALAAIGCSLINNHHLIERVGADLARWYAIPIDRYVQKAQSLAALKQDLLLLERWQRQGEPLNYALGLYPGQRLWLALQQAIDRWDPPADAPAQASVVVAPKTVRLDSLSLFDTGQSQLKPGSLKMLVNALVDIQARPGWLIVVAGHTDSTGNAQANQQLSLQRAEALRDWMLSTSNVPPGCFAVQGFGATRPVASNATAGGRALNRRVEISLVPQADACLTTATPP